MGALNRKEHSPLPSASAIDWKWTIGRNLKNYHPQIGTIVPERVYFYSRAQRSNTWTVIVDMDQSGSMADSVVYGAICGSIFASLPALDTHVVAFDTDDIGTFLDLVQRLRTTEASAYTLRDTPSFTCIATSVERALNALDGEALTLSTTT